MRLVLIIDSYAAGAFVRSIRFSLILLALIIPSAVQAQHSRRSDSQPHTIEGVVVGTEIQASWYGVWIESGGVKYIVPLGTKTAGSDIKTQGDVETAGNHVRIIYKGKPKEFVGGYSLDAIRIEQIVQSTRMSQSSQTTSGRNALANRRWPAFIAAFRAAVVKRDRVALKEMIAIPFNAQGEILNSAEAVFKLIDQEKWWGELKKETAPGAPFTNFNAQKIGKCARNGIFCFEFGSGERWWLFEQVENE